MDSVALESSPRSLYKLSGCIVHIGRSANRGHFVSIVRERLKAPQIEIEKDVLVNDEEEKWYLFDDEAVSLYDIEQLSEDTFGGEVLGRKRKSKKDEVGPSIAVISVDNSDCCNNGYAFDGNEKPQSEVFLENRSGLMLSEKDCDRPVAEEASNIRDENEQNEIDDDSDSDDDDNDDDGEEDDSEFESDDDDDDSDYDISSDDESDSDSYQPQSAVMLFYDRI